MANPTNPRDLAWTQGVIDTIYSAMGALRGRGDGKVYHRYAIDSAEELAWHRGCHFAAQRMMEGAMMAQALRGADEPTTHSTPKI